MSGLEQRYQKHNDHVVLLRSVIFRNGTAHWELRCRECDDHIQWVSAAEASHIWAAIDHDLAHQE